MLLKYLKITTSRSITNKEKEKQIYTHNIIYIGRLALILCNINFIYIYICLTIYAIEYSVLGALSDQLSNVRNQNKRLS